MRTRWPGYWAFTPSYWSISGVETAASLIGRRASRVRQINVLRTEGAEAPASPPGRRPAPDGRSEAVERPHFPHRQNIGTLSPSMRALLLCVVLVGLVA